MLSNVLTLISSAVIFIGGAMVVIGLVTVGLNLSGIVQGGGAQLNAGWMLVGGGAVVAAAGALFRGLDTTWATGLGLINPSAMRVWLIAAGIL